MLITLYIHTKTAMKMNSQLLQVVAASVVATVVSSSLTTARLIGQADGPRPAGDNFMQRPMDGGMKPEGEFRGPMKNGPMGNGPMNNGPMGNGPMGNGLMNGSMNEGFNGPTKSFNGINGINGVSGMDSINRVNGVNGIKGINGINDANGLSGINGMNGPQEMNGMPGMNGPQGMNGMPGMNGPQGMNGVHGAGTSSDPQSFAGQQRKDPNLDRLLNTDFGFGEEQELTADEIKKLEAQKIKLKSALKKIDTEEKKAVKKVEKKRVSMEKKCAKAKTEAQKTSCDESLAQFDDYLDTIVEFFDEKRTDITDALDEIDAYLSGDDEEVTE